MDDFSADTSTTGTLRFGTVTQGVIETPGDADWFAFDLQAGDLFQLQIYSNGRLNQGNYGATLTNKSYQYFEPDGVRVASGAGSRDTGVHSHTYLARKSGTHHFSVESRDGSTGSYALEIVPIAAETGDSQADALSLALGETSLLQDTSRLSPNPDMPSTLDTDWLKIDLQAGETYVLEVDRGPYQYWPAAFSLVRTEVISPTGGVVARTLDADTAISAEVATFTADQTGTYFIKAVGSSFGYEKIYSVAVRETVEVVGTSGNDWLNMPSGDMLPVAVTGGAGDDTISFATRAKASFLGEGVMVNLQTGAVSAPAPQQIQFVMDGIEHASGSSFADTLYGRDGYERLRGLGGNDTFFGSEGADLIDGGGGRDMLDYLLSDTGVSASLLRSRGWAGDAAGDRLSSIEQLAGSNHDDFLWGDHGNNRLEGRHGDDTIVGNGGDDYILAGHGHDVIVYYGNQADYTITRDGIRTEVVHNNNGWEGHDIIGHAEVLRFADGDLVL